MAKFPELSKDYPTNPTSLDESLKMGKGEFNNITNIPKSLSEQAKENKQIIKEINRQKADLDLLVPPEVQEKIAKDFEKTIALGIAVPAVFSLGACAKPPAIEVNQETPSTVTVETTPPTTQETVASTTVTITETTEEKKEFEASMIKNRLIFSASARQFNAANPEAMFEFQPGAEVPLWYLHDWHKEGGEVYSCVLSGVIAGEFKKEVGESGKEELLLPIAFQHTESSEFLIRDITFGDTEFFETREAGPMGNYKAGKYFEGGIPRVFLDNYVYIGMESYTMANTPFKELEKNLKIGDQIAFIILIEEAPGWAVDSNTELPEGINPDYPKIVGKFVRSYYSNNKSFYEAMKENKELPDLKIQPWVLILNNSDK